MLIRQETGDWIDIRGGHTLESLQQPLVRETRDKLSFPFGDIELVQILLPNIHIVYGDMMLKEHQFRMQAVEVPDTVELHFSLSGKGVFENRLTGKTFSFSSGQHNIVYVPELDGTASYENLGAQQFFEIHFLTGHFLNLVKDSCPILDSFAQKVSTGNPADLSSQSQPINFAMHQCIREIMQCPFTGGLKQMFLQAKCLELLTLQAEVFEHAHRGLPESALKSEYDRQCITYAKEYLLQHLYMPPSLSELAAIAGTNEFKLKKGFKALFNNTVFGYLSDARLTQAKELLHSGIPIKEVSDQLGYSSVQHFGNAFRKKFGVSPGKLK